MRRCPAFEARIRALTQAALDSGKPVVAVVLPGPAAEKPRAVLREMDCPYFDSAEDLLAALRGMFDHYRIAAISDAPQRPAGLPDDVAAAWRSVEARRCVWHRGAAGHLHARQLDQAVAAASMIGFPVVLKGSVTGVTHKTELQAVKLGLKNRGRC